MTMGDEWKHDGTHKQPFAIRHPDLSPLAFTGLWGTWHDLDTFTPGS
jgi:putative SOS response-associated peptidase YedK